MTEARIGESLGLQPRLICKILNSLPTPTQIEYDVIRMRETVIAKICVITRTKELVTCDLDNETTTSRLIASLVSLTFPRL